MRRLGAWAAALLLGLLLAGCRAAGADMSVASAVPIVALPSTPSPATVAAVPSTTPTTPPTAVPTLPTLPALPTLQTLPPLPTLPTTISLAAVGDIMLARSIGAALQRDPADTPFAGVLAPLREADVTVGNLECALGSGGVRAAKAYTFLGPPAGAAALADAGFDVVSLANNHSLDYGPGALDQTREALEMHGVRVVGAGGSEAQARSPARLTVKGLRLAFLGYVDTPPEGAYNAARWEAVGAKPGVAWARPEKIRADVAQAREQADLVIVLLHSGYEGRAEPTVVQRAAAHAAVDAGAALVIGAHPHVLQGVEHYRGGAIAYSLGNFVFDGFDGASNDSAILQVTLSRADVETVDWRPVTIRGGRPQLAQGQPALTILSRLERLTATLAR